jgi:hypothetical protein
MEVEVTEMEEMAEEVTVFTPVQLVVEQLIQVVVVDL